MENESKETKSASENVTKEVTKKGLLKLRKLQ